MSGFSRVGGRWVCLGKKSLRSSLWTRERWPGGNGEQYSQQENARLWLASFWWRVYHLRKRARNDAHYTLAVGLCVRRLLFVVAIVRTCLSLHLWLLNASSGIPYLEIERPRGRSR